MVDTRTWLIENTVKFNSNDELLDSCVKELGISRKHARKILNQVRSSVAEYTTPVMSEVPNIDHLLDAMKIDKENWEISQVVSNIWGSPTQPNYQLKLFAKKTHLKSLDKAIEMINSRLQANDGFKESFPVSEDEKAHMAEIMIPDLHLGQYSSNYKASYENTKNTYIECICYFVSILKKQNVDKVLLVMGNDFYTSSSYRNETINGTPQKTIPDWEKLFTDGVELLIFTIDLLQKALNVPIETVLVMSNHDYEAIFYASKILQAYYKNNSNVTIDSSTEPYKFVSYGNSLIGFNHGRDIAYDKLPMLMANKSKKWSSSVYREWHIAHKHHKNYFVENRDVNNVKIKAFPNLTPNSEWAESKGYMSGKEGTALLISKDKGCVAEFYYRKD